MPLTRRNKGNHENAEKKGSGGQVHDYLEQTSGREFGREKILSSGRSIS